jgi:crotonobetainyl-CoA:carnitine CoA-transferase CaiB-like acyl-CoA transferase
MGGALQGITVIDLSRMLPGPYCSMILADHGARVIAIEDKRFEADDLYLSPVNRNKDHMTLNLKSKEGQSIFLKLIHNADVLMEGFRPGVTKRLGIDYETLKKVNPRIIYCSITGYGQDGPYRDVAGHDVNYLSLAGILDIIGEKDRSPSIPGIQIADIVGGGMNAAIGILLAIVAREKTGEGQYIDISMTDGMVGLLSIPLHIFQRTNKVPQRSDTFLSHRYACYNVYETADGRYISIGAVENRFWKNLCDVLHVPEYGPLQYDDNHREEILDFCRKAFKKKTLEEWVKELREKDVCWGKIQHVGEVLNDPLF